MVVTQRNRYSLNLFIGKDQIVVEVGIARAFGSSLERSVGIEVETRCTRDEMSWVSTTILEKLDGFVGRHDRTNKERCFAA